MTRLKIFDVVILCCTDNVEDEAHTVHYTTGIMLVLNDDMISETYIYYMKIKASGQVYVPTSCPERESLMLFSAIVGTLVINAID